jgi:hypothetical protein
MWFQRKVFFPGCRESGQSEERRSTFENANMIIYQRKDLISVEVKDKILLELDELCRMISGFIKSLK